jgi:hypothetical protein
MRQQGSRTGFEKQLTVLGPPGVRTTQHRFPKRIRGTVSVGNDVVHDQLRTDKNAIPCRHEQVGRTGRAV